MTICYMNYWQISWLTNDWRCREICIPRQDFTSDSEVLNSIVSIFRFRLAVYVYFSKKKNCFSKNVACLFVPEVVVPCWEYKHISLLVGVTVCHYIPTCFWHFNSLHLGMSTEILRQIFQLAIGFAGVRHV